MFSVRPVVGGRPCTDYPPIPVPRFLNSAPITKLTVKLRPRTDNQSGKSFCLNDEIVARLAVFVSGAGE